MRLPLRLLGTILALAVSTSLFGNVANHLKKVEGKSDRHRMRNIDFIYMINLDQRPEKFQKSQDQLNPYLIYPCRFSAVNGWELGLDMINDIGVKYKQGIIKGMMSTWYPLEGDFQPQHEYASREGQSYFCHCMSRGAIGIVMSHLSILKDAYDSGYETIWVMEDDIEIKKDPRMISALIDDLDRAVGRGNWDILFTDRDSKNNNGTQNPCSGFGKRPNFNAKKKVPEIKKINSTFRKIDTRYGAYSMIIRRSGMKKILNFYKLFDVYLPYDMDIFLIPNLQLYTVLEDVVTTRIGAESDNGGPNYLTKESL